MIKQKCILRSCKYKKKSFINILNWMFCY